jgi:hypothetical protein
MIEDWNGPNHPFLPYRCRFVASFGDFLKKAMLKKSRKYRKNQSDQKKIGSAKHIPRKPSGLWNGMLPSTENSLRRI